MLNNNLQYAREELGMTQSELGFVFGFDKSTVSCWENNYSVITFKKLIRFCNLYDYSFDFICGLSRKNTIYPKIEFDKKDIGVKLKKDRKELGLTQK